MIGAFAELLVLVIWGAFVVVFYACAIVLWTLALLVRGVRWLITEAVWRWRLRARAREHAASRYPEPRRIPWRS